MIYDLKRSIILDDFVVRKKGQEGMGKGFDLNIKEDNLEIEEHGNVSVTCKLISIEDTFAETKALGDNDSRERNPEMMGRRDTLSVYYSFFLPDEGQFCWENVKQCVLVRG